MLHGGGLHASVALLLGLLDGPFLRLALAIHAFRRSLISPKQGAVFAFCVAKWSGPAPRGHHTSEPGQSLGGNGCLGLGSCHPHRSRARPRLDGPPGPLRLLAGLDGT